MIALSLPATVAVDVLAWLLVHVGAGYFVHRLPRRVLEHDWWLLRAHSFEGGGGLYVRVLRIKRWKRFLPEAGDAFRGGFNKATLAATDDGYLWAYVLETRRAELGHWLTIVPAPLFLLWNPWYVGVVVQAYAVAVNGPCIASQRYNRIRLERVLARRAGDQRRMVER